ncbi:MAG: tetratricopeptide repeat protein [Woeseiaceae bacterium]|nr:tetratricopeptide repeat protein [Woeseiaceae bacterium]
MARKRSFRIAGTAGLFLLALAARAQQTIDSPPAADPDELPPAVAEEPMVEVPPEPELTPREELTAQFERFKLLLADGVLDEADSVAKRIVELAIQVEGPRSNETAKALTNLAIVQHRNEQYDAAEQNFEAAVEIIEHNEDRLNAQLVNPLKGLGASQLANGRPDLASETYGRAIHVTHVNEGPHNLEQVDLLESLAEVYLRLGSIDEARKLQDTIYALNLRNFEGDLMDLVPSLMRRAAWQHRAGFIYDERTTYRRIINIIEDQAGEDDLALIPPLTRLGQSFFFADLSGTSTYQPSAITTGEIYFKRAVRIAEDNPDADWRTLADTNLALGDYYMFQGNEQRARNIYRDVWEILSGDEERLAYRQERLESVNVLRQRNVPEFVGDAEAVEDLARSGESLLRGEIRLSYKVSSRGRATDVTLIEARPEEFTEMLTDVQRELRTRIFRPMLADGEPTTSGEQLLTHRFYYRPSDLEALRGGTGAESEDDAASDKGETAEPAAET